MKALIFIPLLLGACVQPRRSTRTLEEHGFQNIQITGFARASCSIDEDFATGFMAELDGSVVHGVVCHEPGGKDVVRFWKDIVYSNDGGKP